MEIVYTIHYTKRAAKDIQLLKTAKLGDKAIKLCESLVINPIPLNSKPLVGNLEGQRSIRINLQHRIVYEVLEEEKVVKILRMWGHYE